MELGSTDISVQRQFPNRLQWEIRMRPDLRHVEDVPAVIFSLLRLHHLEEHGPGRIVATLNRVVHVSGMIVGILSRDFSCFRLRESLDTLVGLEMNFDINETGLQVE